ncbi:hypothetical protein GCM10010169_64570 [Micromonospora fulviviridis]|nr:hypothetical protein GCM10010169_64570 [Micromonospora fulviviridis]
MRERAGAKPERHEPKREASAARLAASPEQEVSGRTARRPAWATGHRAKGSAPGGREPASGAAEPVSEADGGRSGEVRVGSGGQVRRAGGRIGEVRRASCRVRESGLRVAPCAGIRVVRQANPAPPSRASGSPPVRSEPGPALQ